MSRTSDEGVGAVCNFSAFLCKRREKISSSTGSFRVGPQGPSCKKIFQPPKVIAASNENTPHQEEGGGM